MKAEKESNKKILDHSFTSAQSFTLTFKKTFLHILTISAEQYNNYESGNGYKLNLVTGTS